jgi:hypothetical protein
MKQGWIQETLHARLLNADHPDTLPNRHQQNH